MRTELMCNLPVSRYAVFAEMAWMERRPELGLICRSAREEAHRITPELIAKTLPGLSQAASENIIRWCAALHLCDPAGSLRSLGHEVAQTDEAPVPEQGVYDLWVVQHPLLGSRILHAERLTSTRDGRFEHIQKAPILPEQDRVFASVIKQSRFLLRGFPTNQTHIGVLVQDTRARCRLRWTLDWLDNTNTFRIEGSLDVSSGHHPIQHSPETVELDLWQLPALWFAQEPDCRWSPNDRQLLLNRPSLSGLSDEQQETFKTQWQLSNVVVPHRGQWENAVLEDIPIGPMTQDVAQQWALSRLDRHLLSDASRYSRSGLRQTFATLTEDTPLELLRPSLPCHEDVLERYRENPEVFWCLAAPVDLAPTPPNDAALDSMMVGQESTSASVPPRSQHVIRIPYRGGWSMQQLMRALTHQKRITKLLLVDRFVRGQNNLLSLQLLRDTARVDSFEVWTGDVGRSTMDAIESITGSRPRPYRSVFSRSSQPHDRYLVLKPEKGPPFGWQMSNSPLDARAFDEEPLPETPLLWRDLTAAWLSLEQLPPQIAAWAKEDQ